MRVMGLANLGEIQLYGVYAYAGGSHYGFVSEDEVGGLICLISFFSFCGALRCGAMLWV